VPSYAVWETMVFVLNVLAFMLIGMQLRPIWTRARRDVRLEYCSFAPRSSAVVVLARIAWVMPYGAVLRL
jgi:NhaP-type Na+/H+ or K+/H+ antiporter